MFSASKTAGPSGYNLSNSLRFRQSASPSLTRTPSSSGSQTTFTHSIWLKRGRLVSNDYVTIYGSESSGSNYVNCAFLSDTLYWTTYNGSTNITIQTTQVFRDVSAWYHLVIAVDTTQATASNRVKLYINGSQITAGTFNYPTLNQALQINTASFTHKIGFSLGFGQYFDGYMDEINFIDGQALTPSSFGSTNATTGVWQPARYTGTYGTNGFYLNFTDIGLTSGSNTGLGRDFSGNGNFLNTNNISVTAGVTYDAMSDVPTLTSATQANYAVMNPLVNYGSVSMVLSSANLNWTSNQGQSSSTIGMPSGKWYCEIVYSTINSTLSEVGILNDSGTYAVGYRSNGTKDVDSGSNNSSYGASYTTGDIIGIAIDADAKTAVFYKNNVSQGTITFTIAGPYYFFVTDRGASNSAGSVNFGQRPFAYTPPTGFNRLNAFNLPDSTVVKGNTVMDATLYTGTGSSLAVVNAAGFRPDFVWGKDRGQLQSHLLFDSIRGVHNFLVSNSTAAQDTNNQTLTGFNSNGFQLGTNGTLNQNAQNFVGWQWQAGQGTTSSNTQGSITSTISVKASAGFSIVTYTGNATANATVGHGLGIVPSFFVVKTRSGTSEWLAYHISTGKDGFLQLQSTDAFSSSANYWGSTGPTSTTFQINGGGGVNNNGSTYVAYCWAAIPGYSAFGSYVANASSDGPFIFTGFRPRWIMFKRTTSATNWYVIDTSISPYNASTAGLYPNTQGAVSTEGAVDILSNGFKCRVSSGAFNFPSGQTFAYVAFAENPFKNALAR